MPIKREILVKRQCVQFAMHDELNPKQLSHKMLELSAIAFGPPMKSINISMKHKFSPNDHFRPRLTSETSDVLNEEPHNSCEDDDDVDDSSSVSRGSPLSPPILVTKKSGGGDLVKNGSKRVTNVVASPSNVILPSPPSSTRSSFDHDGVARDSSDSSGEEHSDHSPLNEEAGIGAFDSFQNDVSDVLFEGDEPETSRGGDQENVHDNEDDALEEIKLIVDSLVTQIADTTVNSTGATAAATAENTESTIDMDQEDDHDNDDEEEDADIQELWKDIQINFDGETILPSGLCLNRGVADMPVYRQEGPFRFTNQLSFLKTILTKYICRYKMAMPFLHPVDSVKFKIPHYYQVVQQPMDLGTVKSRLNYLWYYSAAECIADLRLIFTNCYRFNSPTDYVYSAGKKLEEFLDEKLADMPKVEEEIPCPPRPTYEEYLKQNEKKINKKRTDSISEPESASQASVATVGTPARSFGPIKMTTRSERGVMVRKPSKDLPAPISTPQPKPPPIKRVPLNESMKHCLDFVKELFTKKHADYAWPFYKPVNTEQYPDYLQKIKHPMDLSTIRTKIETGRYTTVNEFASDMRLMFSNCLRYNKPESPVIEQARKLRETFELVYARIPEEYLVQKLTVSPSTTSSSSISGSGGSINTSGSSSSSSHNRTPSSSGRSTPSASTSAKSHHHHSVDQHPNKKRRNSKYSSSTPKLNNKQSVSSESNKKGGASTSLKKRHSLDNKKPAPILPSLQPSGEGDRMKQLEIQVATLTMALRTALLTKPGDQSNAALVNAVLSGTSTVSTPNGASTSNGHSNGSGRRQARKNGYVASRGKASASAALKRSLSDDDSDSDSSDDEGSRPIVQKRAVPEPEQTSFSPGSMVDLKQLKTDLENLHAKDLKSVLAVLKENHALVKCDNDQNVEIDFESMPPKTLVALRKFVTSCSLNVRPSKRRNNLESSFASGPNSDKDSHIIRISTDKIFENTTDCDNSTSNWSRAGSRASDLQLSESSSDSESD